MSQEFHAIYEHGVLRPITPLNLPESAEVRGVLHEKNGSGQRPSSSDLLLGLMADESELMDQIVEEALAARESHPFRTNG